MRGRRNCGYSPGVILLAIGAVIIGVAVFAFGNPFGGGAGASPSPTAAASLGSPTPVPSHGDGTCPTSQPAPLPSGEKRTVTIKTSLGDIVIEVDGTLAPIAAGNFVALAACHFYDGIVFHRTASLQDGTPFVIQGGDPEGTGSGGPGYTIADEAVTAPYQRGTVAMARTSAVNSQGSQFFIVLDDDAAAPLVSANTYAIFGKVITGMNFVDAIYQASNGVEQPANPIAMISVTVSGGPAASASPAPASASPAPASASPAPSAASPAASPTAAP